MSLHISIGPMFSSKTTSIIGLLNKLHYIDKKVLVINNILDLTRNKSDFIETHSLIQINSSIKNRLTYYTVSDIYDVLNIENYDSFTDIIIEESQFFKNLYQFVKDQLLINNKNWYIFGLNCDVNQNIIGDIIKLISIADTVNILKGFCTLCVEQKCDNIRESLFTSYKNNNNTITHKDTVVIDIGNNDKYIGLCRKHYIQYKNNN